MSLSAERMRRPNAGSKMSQLLDSEEVAVDQFYEGLYGGFKEEDIDEDYSSGETDSEDSVDSDFSIDEKDESISDDQNEDQSKRKTRNKTKTKPNFNRNSLKWNKVEKVIESKTKFRASIGNQTGVPFELDIPTIKERIISRNLRQKPLNRKTTEELKTSPKAKICDKEWTQKELLEESVITEKINLKSLKEYEKLIAEKTKKCKPVRHSINGPFIRYNSVSMPLIQPLDDNGSEEMSVDDSPQSSAKSQSYSRTFVTFSDEQTYDSLFNSLSDISSEVPKTMECPVTRLPARYFDPISQMPFANIEAFNAIRNQYYKQLEIYGNTNQTEVKQWIEWRRDFGNEWQEWQQKYLSYDGQQLPMDCESQCNQKEPIVESNPKVIHSSRQQKK